MKAEESIKKTIESNGLIPLGSVVVLGLSGGPDSMCLFDILLSLQDKIGFKLKALHVNHMLRGAEADADEAFVRELCEKKGVPCRIVRADVRALAKEQGLTEEEAGRLVRYKALKEYAEGGLIALAHNRDDQAETVLMRIIRGTGIHGLGAMEYKREDGVIRPLLDTPRKEIEDYCERKGLKPRLDSTNAAEDYARNRIRLSLMPLIEEYNPSAKQALVRLAASAREDDRFMASESAKALQSCLKQRKEGETVLDLAALRSLDPALQFRVIASALKELGLCQDLSFERLASIKNAVNSGRGGLAIELPKGYLALAGKGVLRLTAPQNTQDGH